MKVGEIDEKTMLITFNLEKNPPKTNWNNWIDQVDQKKASEKIIVIIF